MRQILVIATSIVIASSCYAADCSCVDWVNKGGYCVDYVKDKIPSFPIPLDRTEITFLKNKELSEVNEGDVAIFSLKNYWHVAYVEKVYRNQQGVASAIDVSEMNFGDRMTFEEFKSAWKSKNEAEWQRAICCGVTVKYDQTGFRKNIALNTVGQIWSPGVAEPERVTVRSYKALADKVREVINQLLVFKERVL